MEQEFSQILIRTYIFQTIVYRGTANTMPILYDYFNKKINLLVKYSTTRAACVLRNELKIQFSKLLLRNYSLTTRIGTIFSKAILCPG